MKKKPLINYTNSELIKDIWNFIKPYKTQFYIGSILRITSDLVWLFPVWALSEIITFTAEYQTGDETLYVWQLLGGIAVTAVYHFITHDLSKYFIYQVAENTFVDAQRDTVKYMYSLDMDWHEKENTGNKMQRITKGGESLNRMIRIYVDMFIESVVNLIAILIILAYFDELFAIILIFFFITYYLLSRYLTKRAVKQSHLVNMEAENYNGATYESINNISVIKSLSIAEQIFPRIKAISIELSRKIKTRIIYFRVREGILNLYQEFFRLSLVGFTLFQIFAGNLEVGVLVLVLLYFGKIEAAAYELSETYNRFINAKIAIFRMKEILRIKPDIEKSGKQKFNEDWQRLVLKDVSFSYHGKKVLDKFSLTIKRGEKIGIVGISGTGKSTLFKLLLKLYNNYSGEIKFDDQSLLDIKRKTYMQKIAIVPQETELFNLSLEDNVRVSGKSKKLGAEEAFEKAINIANIKDFSEKLPQKISTLVGEKGVKLSGGEKQRVGIARAIYKDPELLLLDEATSHLDIISEQKIQKTLHAFFKDITAIVIAHRLSTIKEMDKIVVMDQGKVIEIGSFDQLLKNKKAFYELWEKQKF